MSLGTEETTEREPQSQQPAGDDADASAAQRRAAQGESVLGPRNLIIPGVCLVVAALLYWNVHRQPLDNLESNILNQGDLVSNTVEHIYISVIIAVLVLIIAVPLGVLVTRKRTKWLAPFVLALGNLGQSAPSIGLLAVFGVFFFIGFWAVVVILTAYTALSVLRNTIVGIEGVNQGVLDAARGMGMSPAKVLLTVEMPLAIPVIGAGARTAIVLAVGTVPLGNDLGAGGLGANLFGSITNNRPLAELTVSVMIAILALMMDWVVGLLQRGLTPRGIR